MMTARMRDALFPWRGAELCTSETPHVVICPMCPDDAGDEPVKWSEEIVTHDQVGPRMATPLRGRFSP